MTTIVVRDSIMACDSMISGSFPQSAKKIRRGKDCIIGFAGDWVAGTHFIERYLADADPIRDKDDDIEFIVLKESGIYYLDVLFREVKIRRDYYAIGSGDQAATVAMNMGADAKEAVRQAIIVDQYSGGRVQSLTL